jgi:hypothetical protein
MPLPAIVAAVLPSIIANAPDLLKIFSDKGATVPERNVAAASKVLEIAQGVTGAVNAQDAAEKLQSDPARRADFQQAVRDQWFELQESGGGGIDGARKADAAFVASGAKVWQSPAFIVSILLMVLPFMLMADVFYVHPDSYDGTLRVQIITAVLAVIMIVAGYWIGSSAGSDRKTDMLGQGK